MTPPPIRYPLPTLLVLIALAFLVQYAERGSRPLRSALAARWTRVVEGPPLPCSTEPRVVAGPIVHRVLLLRDRVAATTRPDGSAAEVIGRRMFADVYDVWPLAGATRFYRIGNRRPFGWVPAGVLIPWDTRLAVRPAAGSVSLARTPKGEAEAPVAVTGLSLPVLGESADRIELAVWDPDRPWERVERQGWARRADLPPTVWGVWLSREELLALLRRLEPGGDGEPEDSLRLRAILGRMGDAPAFSQREIDSARAALPGGVFDRGAASRTDAIERLSRVNESWTPEAGWSGLTFRAVPLDALP